MGTLDATIAQRQREGINAVEELADLDEDSLQQLVDNLHQPGRLVPDPKPGAAADAMIPTPAFSFGSKSLKHTRSI